MTRDRSGAGTLAARLAALEVTVETLYVQAYDVLAPDYPGGVRPTGLVTLGGRGCLGRGEHVAFDEAEQSRFAVESGALLQERSGPVGELLVRFDANSDNHVVAGWRRTALEGALIDLALRQSDHSLLDLVDAGGPSPSPTTQDIPLRFLVSFDACADPASRLRTLSRHFPGARYKVDVDPTWGEPAIWALAATGAVEVLDFKERGDAPLAVHLAAHFPAALVEDPPAGTSIKPGRIVRDQGLTTVAEVARAVAAGHRVNLKAPRMGGFLATLEALEACSPSVLHLPASFGGMSEVGVGRRQARALAALFTPGAGNDLAPLRAVEPRPDSDHLRVSFARAGFGA